MADRVWKGVYLLVFGPSCKLSQNQFFDPSTPSMRKGRDGGKNGKKKKIQMKIVATTSLPAVDHPNADRWNAARSRQWWPLRHCQQSTARTPTAGTPHARANYFYWITVKSSLF